MCLPARAGFWTALPLLKLPRSAGPVLSAGVGAPPLAAASTSMPGAHHGYCSQPETSRRTPCYKCPLAAEPANCRPQPRDGPETEAVCTNAHSKGLPAVKAEWGLVPGTAGAGHKLGYCKCSLSVAKFLHLSLRFHISLQARLILSPAFTWSPGKCFVPTVLSGCRQHLGALPSSSPSGCPGHRGDAPATPSPSLADARPRAPGVGPTGERGCGNVWLCQGLGWSS